MNLERHRLQSLEVKTSAMAEFNSHLLHHLDEDVIARYRAKYIDKPLNVRSDLTVVDEDDKHRLVAAILRHEPSVRIKLAPGFGNR